MNDFTEERRYCIKLHKNVLYDKYKERIDVEGKKDFVHCAFYNLPLKRRCCTHDRLAKKCLVKD